MLNRCTNARAQYFADYGGRGIGVCERWRESFDNFLADMGRRPTGRHTLDRRDNDKGYSPDNCRWATRAEQARNRRTTQLNAELVREVRAVREANGSVAAWARWRGITEKAARDAANLSTWKDI
jgi:hypothetical protein